MRARIQPKAVDLEFVNSKVIKSVDPDHPETIAPALQELDHLIAEAPDRSDFYLLRANFKCLERADPHAVISDIDKSIRLHHAGDSAYENLQDHYALKARVELDSNNYGDSLRELELAAAEDYDDASSAFNDGKTKPSQQSRLCVWTLADFNLLAQKLPQDFRPHLFKGIYLDLYSRFDVEGNGARDILAAYERAAQLAPDSALPHYFSGRLYIGGSLGGLTSMPRAKCLDFVVPRSQECLKLDELRTRGVQELTAAIALDRGFTSAYEERAEAFFQLKQYRQAIRDYTDALRLERKPNEKGILYNDRGLASVNLGKYQSAVDDMTQSIRLRCDKPGNDRCDEYVNRADAYVKLKDYRHAVDDYSMAIRSALNGVLIFGIAQYRRIYPEYDAVADDVVADLIRRRYYPQMTYEDFAKTFIIDAKGMEDEFVTAELYAKRGDAYALLGDQVNSKKDYDRVIDGFPKSATMYFQQVNGRWIRSKD
jgi:tetratricopeptide (TPR) repeat protein